MHFKPVTINNRYFIILFKLTFIPSQDQLKSWRKNNPKPFSERKKRN